MVGKPCRGYCWGPPSRLSVFWYVHRYSKASSSPIGGWDDFFRNTSATTVQRQSPITQLHDTLGGFGMIYGSVAVAQFTSQTPHAPGPLQQQLSCGLDLWLTSPASTNVFSVAPVLSGLTTCLLAVLAGRPIRSSRTAAALAQPRSAAGAQPAAGATLTAAAAAAKPAAAGTATATATGQQAWAMCAGVRAAPGCRTEAWYLHAAAAAARL